MYEKIGSKFKRIYGKNIIQLAKELDVSIYTICQWQKRDLDIFNKALELHSKPKPNVKITKLLKNIKYRCNNLKDKKYKYYGGKGIKCFLSREDLILLWERDKADNLKQPSIDRKDGNSHYEFNNCQFIEMAENRIKRSLKYNQ